MENGIVLLDLSTDETRDITADTDGVIRIPKGDFMLKSKLPLCVIEINSPLLLETTEDR